MRNPRISRIVGVVACLAVGLTACGTGSDSGSKVSSSAPIRIASALAVTTLDPTESTNVEIDPTVFDGLVNANAKGVKVPALATKWETSANGTVWTFTLRPNVKFQDGSLLNVSDVVWTYRKIMADKTSRNATYVQEIESVQASGANQVVFRLKHPDVDFLENVWRIGIPSQKVYETIGAKQFAVKPIGTGPYTVTGISTGQVVTLKANPYYWGGVAKIKNVTFQYIADETTRVNALRGGSIDAVQLTAQGLRSLGRSSNFTVKTVPSDKVVFLGLNVSMAPLNVLALRQAVCHAVNVPAIVKGLLNKQATPVGQMNTPPVFGYDASIKPCGYDPALAKRLVQQSGYRGQTITFTYPTGDYVASAADVAQVIGSNLGAVGIKTKLVGIEFATFLSDWFAKSLSGLYLFGYTGLDAQSTFSLLNQVGTYNDPTVTKLFTEQAEQSDSSQRRATLAAISRRYNQMGYYAPLYYDTFNYVSDSRVTQTPRADGFLQPYTMTPK